MGEWLLAASIVGFSTFSSLAAMPMTIEVTENNVDSKQMVKAIITTTVDNHMESSIIIPIIAIQLLLSYGLSLPSFEKFLISTFTCLEPLQTNDILIN